MYHLSDKDLDRLSKEAAEHYEVGSTTSGWEAVEEQLNKELTPDTNARRKRRFIFFLLFFVLFCGTGLTWMLSNSASLTRISSSVTTDAGETSDQSKVQDNLRKNDRTHSADNIKDEQKAVSNDNKIDNNDIDKSTTSDEILNQEAVAITEQKSIINNDQKFKQADPSKSLKSPNQATDNTQATAQPRINNSKLRPVSNRKQPITSDTKNRNLKQDITADLNSKGTEFKRNLKTKNIVGIRRLRDVPDVQTSFESHTPKQNAYLQDLGLKRPQAMPKKKDNNPGTRGLQLGLAYAPDYSNVRFTHRDKVGFNAGLTIGYRFNKRWSLNTGVIITKKNYTAYGKDYHPPKGYWTYNVYLNTVNANCNMIDIPLNVRYDFISNKKNHAFLSTGLSTYFMNKETYDYHFTYNGVYGRDQRSYDDKTKHWFSILNVSTGYERRINRRFSLQIEPYLKIPVKGLGFGKVDLNSYGAYFSVKYQLLSK